MDTLVRPILPSLLFLLAVLGVLQIIPPLLRIHLKRSGSKRLKLVLYGLAFVALYFRISARRKVLTDDGIVLTGSLRTNPLVKQIYLTGSYEPTLAEYVKGRLQPGDGFLDIGANSGHFSLIAAKLGAEVVSVEASPANCRLLSDNVAQNTFGSKIRLVAAAAGNQKGEMEVHENRLNGMWSTTSPVAFRYLRPITRKVIVPLVRVDDILHPEDVKRIRFAKIDVEGAELSVLQGLSNLLGSGRSDLEVCLEFSPSWLTPAQQAEIFSIFRSHGFEAYKLVNREVEFRPYDIGSPEHCSTPPEHQVDIVFSRTAPSTTSRRRAETPEEAAAVG